MRVARAQKIIGVPVPADEMADIFKRLGLAATRSGRGADEAFVVTPPSYRFDIEIEEDLIEEVARVHGFDRIPAHPPVVPAVMHARAEERRSLHDLRAQLAAADYQEVVNFSFVDEAWERDLAGNANPIRLLNPIASQLAVMRTTLVGSLVANVRYNLNRKVSRVRVFEIGRVFVRDPAVKDGELEVAGIRQPTHVGAIAYGPAFEEQWGVRPTRPVDFFDLKGDVELLVAPRAGAVREGCPSGAAPGPLSPDRAGWGGDRLDRGAAPRVAAEIRAPGAGSGVRNRLRPAPDRSAPAL